MIAHDHYETAVRDKMYGLVSRFKPRCLVHSPVLDRYLAASLLQKSIRRDEPELAWQAASYLLENHPAYFWKRLPVIGMEDIGVADLDVTMMAILAGTEPELREQLGGCLKVATALIEIMCSSTKDRTPDDLYDVISRSISLREARTMYADENFPGSLPFGLQTEGGVLERANRLALLAGCAGDVPAVGIRRRRWLEAIQVIGVEAASNAVQETAILGLLRTGSILSPMLFVAGSEGDQVSTEIDDPLLPAPDDTAVPVWVLGQHTRIGLAGFRKFASRSSRMKAFLADAMDGSVSRSKVVGALVFRLDCGQLRRRLDWSLASELKCQATGLGWGIPDCTVPEAMSILRDEFDLLNECRADALHVYLR
ncbi:hypothetical protein KUW17_05650 [Leisingera aquaemixtae]|uniref:hypothetical protein n=1 Tax=Leisingera aquaemixtae TaxID=1396826 RepID=UPI001C955BC4|nr:hypothetical protein [Leisingera aquaemixtae]MBY6066217.1 hypothetical protein [Leisingera aquaemixtae]